MTQEIPLTGGEVNEVVRVGDTVRRTAGPWTPSVQRVLAHLRTVGFEHSPAPLGVDERGREMVSYLPGVPATRPWPAVLRTDAGLHQVGAMAAALAAALRSYPIAPDDVWRHGGVPTAYGATAGGCTTLRHGDLALWNTVWMGDRLAGLIDWDYLEPAPEGWDFAQLAWYAVPLRPTRWADCGFDTEPDYAHRLAVLADYAAVAPAELVELLLDLQRLDRDRTKTWGAAGVHPWDKFAAEGFIADIDGDADWLRSRRW